MLLLSIEGEIKAEDFYWIKGAGNWSDTLHWLSDSGGIPTIDDDVFFDENSFSDVNQSVTVDVIAYMGSMTWSNIFLNPLLEGHQDIYINGSLLLHDNLDYELDGNIYFESELSGNIIFSAGKEFNGNLYFNGAGSWELQSNLNIGPNNIYFNKGELNTMGNPITCGSFYSTSSNNRTLVLQSSIVNVILSGGTWEVNDQLNFNAGSSKILFSNDSFESEIQFSGASKIYHNVVFVGGANLSGSNSFNNLAFSPGRTYIFQSGSTQSIQGSLYARGCSGLIELKASGTNQAFISKTNGDINVSYVTLHSINASMGGGNQFNARQSIDLGNNSNVNIIPEGRDMYWVDGTGNWSDSLHWTSSQGGQDADCLPVIFDNVNFNDNSFDGTDTVHVYAENAYCNNMTWSGNDTPVFISGSVSNKLNIHGSLVFSESMTNLYSGKVFFRDTPTGKTIASASQQFYNDLIFNGIDGGWVFQDSVKVEGAVYLYNGSLNTNDQFFSCYTFHSDSANTRSIELGNSDIEITKSTPYPAWSINNEELNFDGGESSIQLLYNGARFYNYGGDTLNYNNLEFNGDKSVARLETGSDTYSEFNLVSFGSNANIKGNNSFDSVLFTPGNYYELGSGNVQTILSTIASSGTCDGPILIRSSSHGLQANINKAEDTLRVYYTSLQDINADGDAVFIAENSNDLGNNTGWDTIQSSAPGKLYWIDGAGEWSNTAHWSLESNGIGGECIPTPYDTVIFDQYSFSSNNQQVLVDLNNAFCHNFVWTNAQFQPDFSGPSSANLLVFGSMELNPAMDFTFAGPIYFEATNTGQTIETRNVKFYNIGNNIYYSGLGGEWTLLDTLDVGSSDYNRNTIYLHYGSLITNNQYVNCFDFRANSSGERTLALDTSLIDVKNDWYVSGTNLSLVESNSLIRIDSGEFTHVYGDYFPYNDVTLASGDHYQNILTRNADTIVFNNVYFDYDGDISGSNCFVEADHIQFAGTGKVNTSYSGTENLYVIDTLLFQSIGSIYGDDTVNYIQFDSIALIQGNGMYGDALMLNDGEILMDNIFDTLTFSPGYVYQLEGNSSQLIREEFNVKGNNCQPIWLQSTSGAHAIVHKDTAEVIGEFIEMTSIKATGNAIFDAGQFSEDVNNSNEGWIFNNSENNYSLGEDISLTEGDTIYICTENFNGNDGTSYSWQNCTTGEVLGTDSCLMVTVNGFYCLTVNYTDGPGCTRYDTIYVSCELALSSHPTNITCYGYSNGSILTDIEVGVEPYITNWSLDDIPFDTVLNINNLSPGLYSLIIEDALGCISYDTLVISEPDSIILDIEPTQSCFEQNNGALYLDISGGILPFDILWSNDSITNAITNLEPGIYSVIVSDSNNCPASLDELTIEELPELTFNLEGTDLICYGDSSGIINIVNLNGGSGLYTAYEWISNMDTLSFEQNIDSLPMGEYFVTVFDDQGCSGENSISLSEPEEIILTLDGHDGTIYYGLIDLTVEGGVSPYDYLWSNGEITEDLDPLGGGLYTVIVTDGNGCEKSGEIYVEVMFRIKAPNAFSPNNDGINDEFLLAGIGTDLEKMELIIYNRWGEEVFVTNDINTGWNGKMNNIGEQQPEEVYIWTISYTIRNGESRIDKGNLTLLR